MMSSLQNMVKVLRATGSSFSLAESCTGGLASKLITDSPGCSDYFLGSAVTYSNISKIRLLNVSVKTLMDQGAVSEDTAIEMAKGAAEIFNSDYAASTTGIAGPGGATEKKPIGMVCIGLTDRRRSLAFTFNFEGDRDAVRHKSSEKVFELLMDFILEKI
ncbi:MAG TPA: CinA family protein [Candidatus Methanomethylophilaceae archaeon]|nr:CinA family protein [Candidatus Methanomethylophilaceae archaeon]